MFQYSRKKNVSITPDQNMSQGAKCFSTPILYTTYELYPTLVQIQMTTILISSANTSY